MDILSHGLWGAAILMPKYKKDKQKLWAGFLFGVLPDFLAFAPAFTYLIFTGFNESWLSRYDGVFGFAQDMYNFTHSGVIFLAAFVAVRLWKKRFYWPMLAWGFHILLDLFTHPDFYQTPLLFPVSEWRLGWGVSWSNPYLWFSNLILLCAIYFWFWSNLQKSKHGQTK